MSFFCMCDKRIDSLVNRLNDLERENEALKNFVARISSELDRRTSMPIPGAEDIVCSDGAKLPKKIALSEALLKLFEVVGVELKLDPGQAPRVVLQQKSGKK